VTVRRSTSTAVTRATRSVTPKLLPGGHLVQADPFDEVGLGVDQGEVHVVGVQAPRQPAGRRRPGVPGPEDDYAVLHGMSSCRGMRCPS
jgi:hypothetical protein